MKKTIIPIVAAVLVSLSLFPTIQAGSRSAVNINPPIVLSDSTSVVKVDNNSAEAVADRIYNSLNLGSLGLSKEAMKYAYKGFTRMADLGMLANQEILTVIDFSKPSDSKRMYILDVKNMKVLFNTYVAHGKNSGVEYAERFSNSIESLQSSLGFYVTKNIYTGKHGKSLKLSGVEDGWNSNAEQRDVVVHGAPYIGQQRANAAYMGRSFGCPAVPQAQAPKVINLLKNGTCMFIYHPSDNYLHSSKILNS